MRTALICVNVDNPCLLHPSNHIGEGLSQAVIVANIALIVSHYQELIFDPQVIRRFDVSGPRYTSYPTADRFVEAFDATAYCSWLGRRTIGGIGRALSLYFHIPFCNTICYYCACNKIITKDHGRSAKYLKYLGKELALQSAALDGPHDVVQLHWGGGTPTFLSHDEMRHLMDMTRQHFRMLPDGEYSIEVDPRKVDRETVKLLAELGFNRMSVGVQDFDPRVQQAVNRIQSLEETQLVIESAREFGFKGMSVDLIYGLPKQNVISFNHTLDEVIKLSPDRLSIYNYAHLPGLAKPQRRINESDLPSPDAKLQIVQLAIRRLTDAGYVFIGMDHFAKQTDELALAQRNGTLYRNFQGYSTQAGCDLYGFGLSAIGHFQETYHQNVKSIPSYYGKLRENSLATHVGYRMTPDDHIRKEVIMKIMCDMEVRKQPIEERFGIRFDEYFSQAIHMLAPFVDDGLVSLFPEKIVVHGMGRLVIRNVAMCFDAYLDKMMQEQRKFSKTV